MRFGIDNYGVGLGDLLVYSLFLVAAYKAYGAKAARVAFGLVVFFGAFVTAFIPFLFNFLDTERDLLVPSQALFGPAAFLCYLWMKRRWGPERTMAQYLASADAAPAAVVPGTPARLTAPEPASEPASV